MSQICGRALHYVLKIGDRKENAFFFRCILGMKVLRHEEFTEGCPAKCNGPQNDKWSKTMVGYGAECDHFAIELTYNYGVHCYELGNDFGGITIISSQSLERARKNKYPIEKEQQLCVLKSPDGYKFYIIDECEPTDHDPIADVTLHTNNLSESKTFYHTLLTMQVLSEDPGSVLLAYCPSQTKLRMRALSGCLDRGEAYGRIAFAVPCCMLEIICKKIEEESGTILTPITALDTPGKAKVIVLVVADPDGHEICFVDEEGFSELSEIECDADKKLNKAICDDSSQE